MALARVQATGKVMADAAASVALTFATPPTVGNGLVVGLSYFYTLAGVPTCVDNRGNAYVLTRSGTGFGSAKVAVFHCAAVGTSAAPFTLTLSFPSSTGYWAATAIELSGVGTGLAADQVASGGKASGTTATTGLTPALTADEVCLLAVVGLNATQASITVEVVAPVWSQELEELNFSHAVGEVDLRVRTGVLGTTQSCSWTHAASTAGATALVAFKAGAPAAVATAQPYVWGPL